MPRLNCTPRWDFNGSTFWEFWLRKHRAPDGLEKIDLCRNRVELEDLWAGMHDLVAWGSRPPITGEETEAYEARKEVLQRAGIW
jgi:hypothetical protein